MRPELHTEIPGPESARLAQALRRHESRNVTYMSESWPVFWESAAGCNVWDVDGNRFLDLTSAFAVAGLGHGRSELVEALREQAGTLLHGMGDVHPTALKVDLCSRLSELTFERWRAGPAKVVLSNSGFEAVETALKTALLATGRHGIIAFEGGYHGLGYGALLSTGFEKFRAPFIAQLKEVTTLLPYPSRAEGLSSWERRLAAVDPQDVGAIMIEPVQGRGGVRFPPPGFLALLRRWCDQHGVMLIADEILTGFHRTGSFFACESVDVVPDLLCLGKALSGGFPISACVGKAAVMDAWPESRGEALHTSTFLGHPVGCAMALEALRLHEQPTVVARVEAVASTMSKWSEQSLPDAIYEVRGSGALWGIELPEGPSAIRATEELLRRGILILPGGECGNVLTVSPPFEIDASDLEFALGTIAEVVEAES